MEDYGTIELKKKWDKLANEISELNTKQKTLRNILYILAVDFFILFALTVVFIFKVTLVGIISLLLLGVVSVAIYLVLRKQIEAKEKIESNMLEMEKIVMRINFRARVLKARNKGDK